MILQQIQQFFETCGEGPVLPASVLMLLILLYGLLVILGALDLDLFDVDLDFDAHADVGGATSFGFVTLRFLNIGNVPIVIWLGVFGLIWWALSIVLWMNFDAPRADAGGAAAPVGLVARNLFVSVLLAKAATEPLIKVFAKPVHREPEDLIGHECEICTYNATPKSGQARYQTDGAPLLLNVKTVDATLSKGEIATILDYDHTSKTYLVARTASPDEVV